MGGTGMVEGKVYESAIEDLASYVRQEAAERLQKYGSQMTLPSEELLRTWVTDIVDPNHDGAISREEARIGFRQVVNDIESGREYEGGGAASSQWARAEGPEKERGIYTLGCWLYLACVYHLAHQPVYHLQTQGR